jgi:very-short-patch-repair endonuclease
MLDNRLDALSWRQDGSNPVTTLEEVKSRSLRLLDYLSALSLELTRAPKRRLADYEDARLTLRPDTIPTQAKVQLGPSPGEGAWLKVGKVIPAPAPTVPGVLVSCLSGGSDDPWTPPVLAGDLDERASAEGRDPQQLREQFSRWMSEAWLPWAHQAKPDIAAAQLYQRLYDLRLRLQRDTATHELLWGHAYMVWSIRGATIHHPLLLTKCLIDIDQDDGTLSVIADGCPELDIDPLQGLDVSGLEELAQLRDRVRSEPPDPWLAGGLDEVLRKIAAPLGAAAQVVADPQIQAPTTEATVVDTWALFLRPRPERYRRFYEELMQVLADGDEVPVGLSAVVVDQETLDATVGDGSGAAGDWTEVGERLLLPLEANEEQERIVRMLARSRGVTVQGPPGTGKSHTIANLVSHLVAHGKRVLVTAQNEQALGVLRDKIPPDLRDLSISVLGSSQASITELRASVQSIMDAVASVDVQRETEAVKRLGAELDAARATLRLLNTELVDLLADEAAEYVLPSGRLRAADVGHWLAEQQQQLGLIPDRLSQTSTCPLAEADFGELVRLSAQLSPDDVVQAGLWLPSADEMPSGGDLVTRRFRLAELDDKLEVFAERGVALAGLDALDQPAQQQLLEDLLAGVQTLAPLEVAWLAKVRDQAAQSTALAGLWAEQAQALSAVSGQLVELRRRLFGRRLSVPDGDPRVQIELLNELKERFAAGRGLPKLSGKELRRFHEELSVDELEVRTVDEVLLVAAVVQERAIRRAAQARYAELVAQLGAPDLEPASSDFPAALEQAAVLLQDALAWESTTQPELVGRLRTVLPNVPPRPSSNELTELAGMLAAGRLRQEQQRLRQEHAALEARLEEAAAADLASTLWGALRDLLARTDAQGWTTALVEAQRLTALRPAISHREELASRLAAAAPLWAAVIVTESGAQDTCGVPEDLGQLWRWRQAQTWFEDLMGHGDVATLQRRTAEAAAQVRRLVAELGARSARLAVKEHLTDAQRRALLGWLTALKRKGKGTGKYAAKWEAEAREQMPDAMGAVPVWIMPVHRVLESFDPRRTELFDVVIVDESSQCNVLTTGLLALGRKVVVVGDDMQNSPQAVGVDRAKVFALTESYLPFLSQRSLLDAESSLYDVASQIFGDVVLLREHFRCLPDIIGFSNRFYDSRILPLREDPGLAIGPALRPVRVLDGVRSIGQYGDVNEPEAQALVDCVAACCADPAYAEMTFGVVTLLGSAQARLIEQQLLARLGLDFERRHLRVGDPANFQGSERDVIFLSMVADDNRSAATRKADAQRINVAASRARNQMWLFHSVDAARLHPDDYRGQLLTYMYAAPSVEGRLADLGAQCDSDFERAVLRQLLERGFRVRPQYPVGHLRIDLVVQGQRQRLAIECDGDRFHGPEQWEADLRRQQILERLGWSFWRIRGSAFYRNPNAALNALWGRLDELEIAPMTSWKTPHADDAPTAEERPSEKFQATSKEAWTQDDAPETAPSPTPLRSSFAARTDETRALSESGVQVEAKQMVHVLERESPPDVLVVQQMPIDQFAGSSVQECEAESAGALPAPERPEALAHGVIVRDLGTGFVANGSPGSPGGPSVLEGMRHVAWIRPTEASAALAALAAQRDQRLTATENLTPAVARYFPPDSPEARKFRAQILIVRERRDGERWVCWLRDHEAQAVILAAREGRDIPVKGADGRLTALVNYHHPDAEMAVKYRSVTRLLRPTKLS